MSGCGRGWEVLGYGNPNGEGKGFARCFNIFEVITNGAVISIIINKLPMERLVDNPVGNKIIKRRS